MATTTSCARCGGPLADGQCPGCDRSSTSTFIHREIVVLVILCVLVAGGFLLTRAAAGASRALRRRDAAHWYDAGQRYLADNQTPAAISALRRATAIDHDNRAYRLALAAALAAAHEDTSARQVLLRVRESTPEDPEINVRLAQLAARQNDPDGAVRYYQNALYGAWSGDQLDRRRQVSIELIRYLLGHQQRGRALSELLVLSGNLPDDVPSHALAGRLFMEAGDPRRGFEQFRQALRLEPGDATSLAGAGEAAFESGDYGGAQRYLREIDQPSTHLLELREVSDLVLSRDPLRPGLSLPQRQQRVMLGFTRALEVLDECAGTPPADRAALEALRSEAKQLEPELALSNIRRRPESIDFALRLIYRVETSTSDACGQRSAVDRALILIGRRHEADLP